MEVHRSVAFYCTCIWKEGNTWHSLHKISSRLSILITRTDPIHLSRPKTWYGTARWRPVLRHGLIIWQPPKHLRIVIRVLGKVWEKILRRPRQEARRQRNWPICGGSRKNPISSLESSQMSISTQQIRTNR